MLSWGKGKEGSGLIEQSDETRLKAHFKNAVHGSYCRTRTYLHETTRQLNHQFWREAVYLPYKKGWIVYDVFWKPIGSGKGGSGYYSGLEPVTEKKPLSQGKPMTFFEAIEKLSLYESGQGDLGYFLREDNEEDKLGEDYFIFFAEREGIAFDALSMPHPTLYGYIVSEESFPESAEQKAKDVYKKKSVALPSLPDDIAPRVCFSPLLAESIDMQPLLAVVERAARYAGECSSARYYFSDSKVKKLRKAFEKVIKAIGLDGIDNRPVVIEEFKNAYDFIELYMYLGHAKSLYKEVRKFDSGVELLAYKDAITKACEKISDMGYPEQYNDFADEWATNPNNNPSNTQILKEAATISKWFEDFQNDLRNASETRMKEQETRRLPKPKGPNNV